VTKNSSSATTKFLYTYLVKKHVPSNHCQVLLPAQYYATAVTPPA